MKTKLLPILLILLVLLNGFLIFMLINKPHERPSPNQKGNFLTEQLHFSDKQKKNFRLLDNTHRKAMGNFNQEVRRNKDILFNSFSKKGFNFDSIAKQIGSLEAKKEIEVYLFFSKVRTLCSEEQVKIFDNIVNKALRGKNERPQRGGRNHPPRKDGMPPPR